MIRVFNDRKWILAGGDCKHDGCNNDCFYEEADVIRTRITRGYEILIDVRFKNTGRFSPGHFLHSIKLHPPRKS